MTRFEERGVELQQDSVSRFQAEKRFEYSCNLCCNRGYRIECECCAIRIAHEIIVEASSRPRIEFQFCISYQ